MTTTPTDAESTTESPTPEPAPPPSALDASDEPVGDEDEPSGPSTESSTTELRIGGMTCASCVSKVEKALNAVWSVESAEVNFATGRARVRTRRPIRHVTLTRAIEDAGYGAEVLELDEAADLQDVFETERRRAEAELRGWLTQWTSAALGSIFLLLTMTTPGFGWVHALVASAVQVGSGRRFYRGAWRGLKARTANKTQMLRNGRQH